MYLYVAALLAIQLTPSTGSSTPPQIRLDPGGRCVADNQRIDMDRVMLLENRTLEIDGPTGPLRLQLDREVFISQEIGDRSPGRTYSNRIDTLVRPGEDIDIDLKLAIVNGRLMLYWRETYQHRFYSFGLIALEGRALFGDQQRAMIPFCEGQGGSYSVM